MLNRMIPMLLILTAACNDQLPQPCGAPDGGGSFTGTRVVHPQMVVYTDAKAACEAMGLRLTTARSWDDRPELIAACEALGADPCWTDDWGFSTEDGTGVGVVRSGSVAVVASANLSTYLAHPICEVPAQ